MCSISDESAAGNTLAVFVKISFERGRTGALPCSVTRPHCRVSAGTEGFTGDEYVFYLGRECCRQYSCGIVKALLSERGRIGALPCSVTRSPCRAAAGTEGFTGDEYVFYLGRECRRQYSCGIVKALLSERGRIGASVSSPYPPTPGEKTKKSAPD